ncbi:hypothetical protein AHAS_Ahas20G0184200 [Arachis hypogaea]
MKKQRVIRNKPTTLEIHLGSTMTHTPKHIIPVGGTTQTLGGETNRIKAKIRDATTPTTMQLTNTPHRVGYLSEKIPKPTDSFPSDTEKNPRGEAKKVRWEDCKMVTMSDKETEEEPNKPLE